ncbi:MAG: TetR/AcrR family transcriptional regulator [Nocardioides sp.]|nr:TetR/AcrR family transcriptional regulator [Nocardioides sp.]
MSSHRHITEPPEDDRAAANRDAYLDAARECILDVGWRRTTLTEVARRAGVSRMTIYRAWADMPTLLGDLMTREWVGILTRVTGGVHLEGDQVSVLRSDLVEMVRALRANELFVRIVELDPELVLPYLLARRGRSQDAILERVESVVRAGQETRAIRRGNPTAIARSLVLAAHGFVISAQTMVDDHVSETELDVELGRVVEGLLAP